MQSKIGEIYNALRGDESIKIDNEEFKEYEADYDTKWEELTKRLDDDQIDLLDELYGLHNLMGLFREEKEYIKGFKDGLRVALETLQNSD